MIQMMEKDTVARFTMQMGESVGQHILLVGFAYETVSNTVSARSFSALQTAPSQDINDNPASCHVSRTLDEGRTALLLLVSIFLGVQSHGAFCWDLHLLSPRMGSGGAY